ncbi:MAG: 50S ribosomal protein L10 [Candidatus Hydrogenedentes bacterium]|nr:50S ribosomal protein L10 [Candidatus Hydrogenedentota bacterium]
MPTQEKEASVAEFLKNLGESEVAIATKYVGINVAQVTELRRRLREANVEYKVFKNTLSRIALREAGVEKAADCMQGPTAWAFCKDPVTPAKILKQFGTEVKFVTMAGGVLSGRAVTGPQLEALASLPPRDVLIAQVVGTIAMPLRNCVGVLNALPRNLVNVLDQIRKQKEEGTAQAA